MMTQQDALDLIERVNSKKGNFPVVKGYVCLGEGNGITSLRRQFNLLHSDIYRDIDSNMGAGFNGALPTFPFYITEDKYNEIQGLAYPKKEFPDGSISATDALLNMERGVEVFNKEGEKISHVEPNKRYYLESNKIKAGDIVEHEPSGEIYLVVESADCDWEFKLVSMDFKILKNLYYRCDQINRIFKKVGRYPFPS